MIKISQKCQNFVPNLHHKNMSQKTATTVLKDYAAAAH